MGVRPSVRRSVRLPGCLTDCMSHYGNAKRKAIHQRPPRSVSVGGGIWSKERRKEGRTWKKKEKEGKADLGRLCCCCCRLFISSRRHFCPHAMNRIFLLPCFDIWLTALWPSKASESLFFPEGRQETERVPHIIHIKKWLPILFNARVQIK